MVQNENNELHKDLPNVHVALLHWPVLDRAKTTVCTNVTNFDIQDIARACRTYGIRSYYIVNKMREQLMFVERVIDHWKTGYGVKYNPMRSTALHRIKTKETLEKVIADIGDDVLVVATAARKMDHLENVGFRDLKEEMLQNPKRPVLIVFGTGFGLHEEALKMCHYILEPISGGSLDNYKHLSVRSAVSICLDRLLSTW